MSSCAASIGINLGLAGDISNTLSKSDLLNFFKSLGGKHVTQSYKGLRLTFNIPRIVVERKSLTKTWWKGANKFINEVYYSKAC